MPDYVALVHGTRDETSFRASDDRAAVETAGAWRSASKDLTIVVYEVLAGVDEGDRRFVARIAHK